MELFKKYQFPRLNDNVDKYINDVKLYETSSPDLYGLKGEDEKIKFVDIVEFESDMNHLNDLLLNMKMLKKQMYFFIIVIALIFIMFVYKLVTFNVDIMSSFPNTLLFILSILTFIRYRNTHNKYIKSVVKYINNINLFSDKYFSEF
jgi:hypothetical protein